jgi:ABC-type branched-subunit amino acid transport system permease subunit
VTILPEALRGLQGVQELVYGLALMLFILFMPSGIAGILRKYGILPREILSPPNAAD